MESSLRTLQAFICVAWIALSAGMAMAADRGTEAQAKALVAKAIAAYDAKGRSVFSEMTAPGTAFVDRDLYIFVIGPDHKTVAHGFDPSRVGMDVLTLRDATGELIGKKFVDLATPTGVWVHYVMKDPLTGKDEPKISWLVRHDDYIFGCGIYKPAL
jgi:signal transduction histidine kinase